MHVTIRICEESDIPNLTKFAFGGGHSIEDGYFETAFAEQQAGKRLVFLLFREDVLAGYTHLNFHPQYQLFQRFGIPEIQDLFVHPNERKNGLGAQLITACEREAKTRGHTDIGIGVGVTGKFGSAQRLYHRLGYTPDGNGAVFERQPIQSGEMRPIDDRLCMMLVKVI